MNGKKIIITVIVVLLLGLAIWSFIKFQYPFSRQGGPTDKEIQSLIQSTTATAADNLSKEEKERIKKSTTATAPDSLTIEERQQIIDSMTAN